MLLFVTSAAFDIRAVKTRDKTNKVWSLRLRATFFSPIQIGDSFNRGHGGLIGDCPRKSGTSGHRTIRLSFLSNPLEPSCVIRRSRLCLSLAPAVPSRSMERQAQAHLQYHFVLFKMHKTSQPFSLRQCCDLWNSLLGIAS